ncbi:formin-like protein 17 [Hibiscus syriacus]|uniref:formin-like protein 17 n=1 Tax=Hibiscus syriacus TaxID=106335 RepID=UPI0019227F5A|nr:formin-like protein 17 [Hibiscus syriacus]
MYPLTLLNNSLDSQSAILALDDTALDPDQIENLIKFFPTKEEIELLKIVRLLDAHNRVDGIVYIMQIITFEFAYNLITCSVFGDSFFLELMTVPPVESKLRVFLFKIQFYSQVSDLRNSLDIVNSAVGEVRNSVKLKRIMQTILSLGNALNQGTARGSAVGFRLDSLLKLTDTRARNKKMTLMHYLCKVLSQKLPELIDFPKDLATLESATKVQLKCLADEMQAISKGLEKVIQELAASEKDGPVSATFCKTVKEFLSFAEGEVKSLTALHTYVGKNADALAHYFGEDPARCPFERVMATLLSFSRMFVKAHEENCKQLENDKKKAKEAENEKPKNYGGKTLGSLEHKCIGEERVV